MTTDQRAGIDRSLLHGRLFEQPADLEEDTPQKPGRASVEDMDAAGPQGEAAGGDRDGITAADNAAGSGGRARGAAGAARA